MLVTIILTLAGMALLWLMIWSATVTMPTKLLVKNFPEDVQEALKPRVDAVRISYLLCGNENSRTTLVYLVGGTGFSAVWFNHIKQMEQEYRVLTFDYPYGVENLEELADLVIKFTCVGNIFVEAW